MIISTLYDVLYVDINEKKEVDIDEIFKIQDIKAVENHQNQFYILANKCQGTLGFYLLQLNEKKPEDNAKFIYQDVSKLEIGDAKIFFHNDKEDNPMIIVSFKTIYLNSFNLIVIDLKKGKVNYRYESYHLWETSL